MRCQLANRASVGFKGEIGVKHHGRERQLGRRICMHQAATHRATIACLAMSHPGERCTKQWHGCQKLSMIFHIPLPARRPHDNPVGTNLDLFETRQAIDIDQRSGTGQPHCHHRHQTLATRQ